MSPSQYLSNANRGRSHFRIHLWEQTPRLQTILLRFKPIHHFYSITIELRHNRITPYSRVLTSPWCHSDPPSIRALALLSCATSTTPRLVAEGGSVISNNSSDSVTFLVRKVRTRRVCSSVNKFSYFVTHAIYCYLVCPCKRLTNTDKQSQQSLVCPNKKAYSHKHTSMLFHILLYRWI